LTYRIYDYNRKGADGLPRELHTELAKEAVNFDVLPDYRTKYDYKKDAVVPLVNCEYFTTDLLDLDKPLSRDFSGLDSFVVVMGLEGEGTISTDAGDVTIRRGETVLLPASINKATFTPGGKGLKILNSYIG
nr:mannose-6-phosphate isomerase [Bacteroidales bacterium]